MKLKIECPILHELVARGVEVTMTKDGYKLQGFYKSGTVTLIPLEPGEPASLGPGQVGISHDPGAKYMALARYDESSLIREVEDLVALNAKWYDRTVERSGAQPPHPQWEDLLIKFGYVKVKTETVTKYIRS